MTRQHIEAKINGDNCDFLCESNETLLSVIRNQLQLTGTKEGCSTGDCGACSVMLDGRLVCSCLTLAVEVEGKNIDTIEGMSNGEDLHVLQRKFLEHAALTMRYMHARIFNCSTGSAIGKKSRSYRNRGALLACW